MQLSMASTLCMIGEKADLWQPICSYNQKNQTAVQRGQIYVLQL